MNQHPKYHEYTCDDAKEIYKNGIHLIGTTATSGYRQYGINRKSLLGHRLVTEMRLGRELTTSEQVNHIDLDKTNNHIDNLELVTIEGNIHHYWQNTGVDTSDISMQTLNKSIAGERNGSAKLTNEQAKSLIQDVMQGMTNKQAGLKYGLHPNYVSLVRHKKRWKSAWVELGLESAETIPSGSTPK